VTVESTAARKARRSAGGKAGATGTERAGADAAPAQEGSGTTGTAGTTRSKRAASTGRTGKATGTTGGTRAKQTAAKPRATKKAAAPAAGTGTAAEEHQLVQLLTPEGKRVKNAEYDPYVADLTPEDLRGLYRDMVLTRRFDAEATSLQRQGELGLWASLLGQEAAQIGSGRATRPDDYVFPTYREHGVAWCRGVDPTNLLGMFRGVNNGGWDPNSNNFHLYTIVIGSQALHATGYAMGVAKDGADAAVIAYFGDGASSQGDVAEAFTFSAVYNAPVVFF
jgi:pyruvate dehydrogenase E1 component alpha subunit